MMYYDEDAEKWYMDLDGIRIVYEANQNGLVKPVGWYRPDGWEGNEA